MVVVVDANGVVRRVHPRAGLVSEAGLTPGVRPLSALGLFPTGFQVQHATGSRRLVLPCCSGSPSENRCQATCERGAPPQPIRDIRCDRRRGDPPALSRAQKLGDAVRRVRQRAESAHGSKPKGSGSLPTARTVPHKRTSTICSSSASGASRTAASRAKLRQRSRGTSALAPNHPSGGSRRPDVHDGLGAVGGKLAAQAAGVAVERPGSRRRLEAPNVAQQLVPRPDTPGVSRKSGEQRELERAQLDALAGDADLGATVSISIAPTRCTRRVAPCERRCTACRAARWWR